ncbi:MAG: hypothetical protein L0L58_07465, partial [Tetragenococcus koreensis]|nr:hypothetical protein [Tetragenococcus koreensis]
ENSNTEKEIGKSYPKNKKINFLLLNQESIIVLFTFFARLSSKNFLAFRKITITFFLEYVSINLQ